MMISMPVWMFILFLAVAMVAGLAAALLWVNLTDLKKIREDLNDHITKDFVKELKKVIHNAASHISDGSYFYHYDGKEIIMSDQECLEDSKKLWKWNDLGISVSYNGPSGPWKLISRQEDTHQ